MSDKTCEEHSNDDELAPMVDGLSGALCIFILITTVFMLSGMETVITGGGRYFADENSAVNYGNNIVYFDRLISLSKDDYDNITAIINSSGKDKITLEAYTSDMTKGDQVKSKRNLVYNLLEFKKHLNIENMRITLKISDENFCGTATSCIKWSIE